MKSVSNLFDAGLMEPVHFSKKINKNNKNLAAGKRLKCLFYICYDKNSMDSLQNENLYENRYNSS